ncbi:UvrD-helicase domain-containing protein [Noviherbaspirillum massiliense]|uniref:UvrD-helicase domain-containing protein n=1 Tax=Noviherbaspirillum massiliense TaxID=1465823 RepID=UPI0002F47284|nr:ATP-dependent helicase [Noviherbaspirillum massiliense]
MIELAELYRAVKAFRGHEPDDEQKRAIEKPVDCGLMIVAGPGSGKTTVLTLRILKLVLVDGVPPPGIVATTFTKKAAQELRSRVLGWGFQILDRLLADSRIGPETHEKLAGLDINQVWTGTIDSLCEQLLRDHRPPGTQPPVLADEFVARTLLLRDGMFAGHRYDDDDLDALLRALHSEGGGGYGYNLSAKLNLVQSLWGRLFNDLVDWEHLLSQSPADQVKARQILGDIVSDYHKSLQDRGMVDFALLEFEVLQRLRNGQLDEFRQGLRVVLVDEYQDTNLLQEQIYFQLAKSCNGALCVVGDDDQSLYRFRGATVDLFRDFESRYRTTYGKAAEKEFLANNYRSTKSIISFVNAYAGLDAGYQSVRVKGKPQLAYPSFANDGVPVLGMFRPTVGELADDLADLIYDVFRGKGFSVPGHGHISCDSDSGGDIGDCALLCSSPAEYSSGGKERLPLLLRQALAVKPRPVEVFNPRGEDIASIPLVQNFGGFLLKAVDPDCTVLNAGVSGIPQNVSDKLRDWVDSANTLVSLGEVPKGLTEYIAGWAARDPGRAGYEWPKSISIIQLIYGVVHYFPSLHNTAEGQVYLEVFTRQLAACEQTGKFKGRMAYNADDPGLGQASIKELLRDFFGPIAAGTTSVDEELIESFPRDQLSVLSIHQSKGLEFPLTIVDVGSDFKGNYAAQRFKRFPSDGGPPHRMEDMLRRHSSLGPPTRSPRDRAFDDLYRQFFVAFSRPQDVLILVGINPTLPGGNVANVATGWDRIGVCHWAGKNLPFTKI